MAILLIGYILIYSLAKFGLWLDKKEVEKIEVNKSEVVGVIIKVGSMKGSYAVAEYFVNNKRYERKDDSPANDIYIGEHYVIFYNKVNPSESRIDYTKPIFLSEEVTKKTTGIIITKDWAKIKFSYTVDGVEHTRFQKISDVKRIGEGETFTVEYLVSNPNIAILRI